MVPAKCKYADSESTAYLYEYTWYSVENKEVPDRNIGVPPVELPHSVKLWISGYCKFQTQ